MLDRAELRRAAEFLQNLEKNLGLTLTNTAPIPPYLSALNNRRSTNPQETPSAPPLTTLQPTNLAHPRRN
jgi:hypothetical protein